MGFYMNEAKILILLVLVIGAVFACGCSNRRYYIGVDDYGEVESMDHTFKTKRPQDRRE
jgi:hypothetical protein